MSGRHRLLIRVRRRRHIDKQLVQAQFLARPERRKRGEDLARGLAVRSEVLTAHEHELWAHSFGLVYAHQFSDASCARRVVGGHDQKLLRDCKRSASINVLVPGHFHLRVETVDVHMKDGTR